MEKAALLSPKNIRKAGFIILLWLGTAWLLYPVGGTIFMISRIMVVYINKTDTGTSF